MVLQGKICLVTGATRGLGKGIALQLGQAGATVYITGRTAKRDPNKVGSSLEEVAEQIATRGGKCVPVQCDHSKDGEIKQLFEKITEQENGCLDVLVNNAYAGVDPIMNANAARQKFYMQEPTIWDDINNVGLRNHYMCTVYGARMMVERQSGLIVTISSPGGLKYLFNVAYGIGKEACDRMMVDCGIELKSKNVACVSLWPGFVRTEKIEEEIAKGNAKTKKMFEDGESPEFSGLCISRLATDPNLMKKTARILTTSALGQEYNLKDINGKTVSSLWSVSERLKGAGWKKISYFIPKFVKIPTSLVHFSSYKF